MSIKNTVKLGVAPTRRMAFSLEDARKFKRLTLEKLTEMGINYVDIDWLNEDGILVWDVKEAKRVIERFKQENVDALFIPHVNFGCESMVTMIAKELKVPVLLWGPRDEGLEEDGTMLRYTQCGMFATGKDLLRYSIPFTYIENCRLTDEVFERDVKRFMAAANVVKTFRTMRIGQISTRPAEFLSVMCNEGELAEKFGIAVEPIALNELLDRMADVEKTRLGDIEKCIDDIKSRIDCGGCDNDKLAKMSALKIAMKEWADEFQLDGIALQCWDAFHEATGVMPCFINSELSAEGLPIGCEMDILGTATAVLVQAAGGEATFFADVAARHQHNDNGELLWHCGTFPYALKKQDSEAKMSRHYVLPSAAPGIGEWQLKDGTVTICRFDSSGGKYYMLTASGKTIDGPKPRGAYVWVEFPDWPALERKMMCGPYIHHVVGTYADVAPVLEEASKYLGIIYDPA